VQGGGAEILKKIEQITGSREKEHRTRTAVHDGISFAPHLNRDTFPTFQAVWLENKGDCSQDASDGYFRPYRDPEETVASSFQDRSRLAGALMRHEDVLARCQGLDHPDIATSITNLASRHNDVGNYETALKLFDEALAMRKRVLHSDHSDIAASMHHLAHAHTSFGHFKEAHITLRHFNEALKLHEEALALRKRIDPDYKDPEIASSMYAIAHAHENLENYKGALEFHERALSFQKRVLPTDHPDIATRINCMSSTHEKFKKYWEALKSREEALAIQKRINPDYNDDPEMAASLMNVASTYDSLQNCKDVLELHESELMIRQGAVRLAPDHPDIATLLGKRATSLGNHKEALKLHEEALAHRESLLSTARLTEAMDREISAENTLTYWDLQEGAEASRSSDGAP
jgi:tetratricopeptide (TPR) repeat protein